MNSADQIINELAKNKNDNDAAFLQRFFKTGKGQYGEGDLFLGLRVPYVRQIVKKYQTRLTKDDLNIMLSNKWHEVRLAALIAMTKQMPKVSVNEQKDLYNLYLNHIGVGINNWDLVDVSCPKVVGYYLSDKDKYPLYDLAKGGLWQKRVSVISTFYFLSYKNNLTDTYKLAEILVYEQHDLLQKAVGWALRELGKYDSQLLKQFLDKYAATMPRTMLRYSLEKMDTETKKYYMGLHKK